MIYWFCLGTAAELIKIFPVIQEADNRKIEWYVLSTGQSGNNFLKQYKDFNLPESRLIKIQESNFDLSSSVMAFKWFFKTIFISKSRLLSTLKKVAGRSPKSSDLWFVHGDTLSTLVGSFYSKRLRIPSVHVEAGMRSHHLLSPFPEEISRRMVSKMTTYHMAPDENAKNNLINEGFVKNIIVTHGNTVMDTLILAIKKFNPIGLPLNPYALANIHRFENLNSEERWNKILAILLKANLKIPIVFVLMPNTAAKLNSDLRLKEKLIAANIKLVERLPFSHFVHLMNNAAFMLTDGGSNQQECYHLGKPCLILRDHTESIEGIGTCCVLSKFSDEIIDSFLEDPNKFRRDSIQVHKSATDYLFDAIPKC
jgi:UDP-N-acetylglucosamine 2-epimerase (non-hydrolysing)